jgi:predicted ester cyclase
MNELLDLAREGIDVFNRGDWGRMRELMADHAVYEETGTGLRLEGWPAIEQALKAWREGSSDISGTIARGMAEGDTTVIEVLWKGTHTGPLEGPAGALPPTGRAFQVYSTFWQRWEDNKVVEERNHLDVLGMLAQLGVLPSPTD